MFWLWIFLIYWLLLFVACYIATEVGQNYFYDEVTPYATLKVGVATLLMAAGLTWWDPSSVDLFVSDLANLAILAVVAFVLFCLVIRFHAPHALMIGPLAVVLVAFTAAMAIDSLKAGPRANLRDRPIPPSERTIRKSSGSSVRAAIEPEEPSTPKPAEPATP